MPSVDIAEGKGDAADFVHAEIGEDGRVLMVRNSFAPGDYETEVTAAVDEKDKDRLLLALLEELSSREHGGGGGVLGSGPIKGDPGGLVPLAVRYACGPRTGDQD